VFLTFINQVFSNWNPYRLLPPSPLPLSIPKLPSYLKLRLPTHLTESLIDGPKPQTEKFTPRDYYRSRFYNDHPNYSRTLFLFRPSNPIRRFCHYLNDPNFSFWKNLIKFKRDLRIIYHLVIWTAIIGSTIVGGLNTPRVRFEYFTTLKGKGDVYWHLNTVFTSILLFEFLIMVIDEGFIMAPRAYLRSFWNWVDLVVLIFQLIDVILVNNFPYSASRILHMFVSLRALRLITKTKTLRKTLHSIFVSGFFKLLTVILILLAFIVPFAVIGNNLFGGKLAKCNSDGPDINALNDCIGTFVNDGNGGNDLLMPRVWANPYLYSFDTLGSSLMILIEIASREKWIDVMRDTMSIMGSGLQPKEEASWWNCLFFVAYCFGVQLIGIATFTAVIINNHRESAGTAEITEDQKNWIDFKKQLNQVKPSKKMLNRPTDLGLKQWCFKIVTNKQSWWNKFCSIVYALIFLLILLGYYHMSNTWRVIRLWLLVVCLIVAGLNEIFTLSARGKQVYFSNILNIIFLVIIAFALIIQVSLWNINLAEAHDHNLDTTTILVKKVGLCLTLLVGLKLIVKLDPLLQLIYILKASLKDILQLAYVWFIIFVIYAIAMNQGLGNVKWGKNMSYYVNASDYYRIFLMLFRMSTGEGWNDIMYDFKVQAPYCIHNKDYLKSDCGDPWMATILFVSFHAISVYIFSSMFVIFLLDTFSYCYEIFASFSFLSRQDLREFKKIWSQFDPLGVGYVQKIQLIPLLKSLDTPFKVRLYPTKFNHVYLCNEYNRKYREKFGMDAWQRGTPVHLIDNQVIKAYWKWLQRQLNLLETTKLKQRKLLFNSIYIECSQHIMHSRGRGLQFNQLFLLVVESKLINPLKCFSLKDILIYQHHRDKISEIYYRHKIQGILKIYLKKRRLQKLIDNLHNNQLPQIVLEESSQVLSEPVTLKPVEQMARSDSEESGSNSLSLNIPKLGFPQRRASNPDNSNSSSPDHSPMS
jgi:hypothetical protein